MLKQRRRFSNDFKTEAVLKTEEPGSSVASVARDLDIHASMLSKWRREYFAEQTDISDSNGQTSRLSKDEEIRQLRRQLVDVTEERDILKKAIAVFSKRPK